MIFTRDRTGTATDRASTGASLTVVTVLVGGASLGVATQILQGLLPGNWNVLANSGVMWCVGAFVIGLAMPTIGAALVGGPTALVVASLLYYEAVDWFEGIDSGGRGALLWSLAGLVAGPVFGLAGHLTRVDRGWRWLAVATVAGVLFGEGVHLVWLVGVDRLWPAGLAELIVGIGVVGTCALRDRRWWAITGIVAAATAATMLGSRLVEAGFQQL